MMYNVKGTAVTENHNERDQAVCMDICVNQLHVEQVEILETVRLGKTEQGNRDDKRKPRALLVKVIEVGTKWEIVKRAKRLKDARKEEYKTVYIVPDLTLKERIRDKELMEQLKAKRESGEQGWYTNKGQIKT